MYTDTRERILRTAITLFARHGFDNVPMREIAFDAGITRTEMSMYFKNKDILLGAILEYIPLVVEHYEPTREEIVEQLETGTARDVLYRFYTFYHWDNDNFVAYIYRFVYMEQYRESAVSMLTYEHFIKHPIRNLARTLKILIELEAIPPCDADVLAEMWHRTGLICGMQAIHFDAMIRDGDYEASVSFFIDIAVRGVEVIPVERIRLNWIKAELYGGAEPENRTMKEKIMYKALDLFSEHGYSKVSVRKIAEECGIEASTIYSHYSSKSSIMKEIVDKLTTSFTDFRFHNPAFEAALEDVDPEKIILTLASTYPPVREEEVLKLYTILMREQYYDEDLKDFFLASVYRDRQMVKEILDKMVSEGRVRPCDSQGIAVAYVHVMCSLTFAATVFPKDFAKLDEMRAKSAALLVSLIINGYIKDEN